MEDDFKKIARMYGVDPDKELTGASTDISDPHGHLRELQKRMAANDAADAKIPINVHYTEAAGSDPVTMEKIAKALADNLPFGLKCLRSSIIFIPHKLKAYWVWGSGEGGPVFNYTDKNDLINGVKIQYLSHKEFVTTAELAALAKIILYENAIENLESWRGKILPESGEPSGSMVSGTGRILPGGAD